MRYFSYLLLCSYGTLQCVNPAQRIRAFAAKILLETVRQNSYAALANTALLLIFVCDTSLLTVYFYSNEELNLASPWGLYPDGF